MSHNTPDVLIVGGGMVGLCLAHQLLERDLTSSITVLDKEPGLGRHSSGRNSGVLHAGLYQVGSVKARVCVWGARRLRPGYKSGPAFKCLWQGNCADQA